MTQLIKIILVSCGYCHNRQQTWAKGKPKGYTKCVFCGQNINREKRFISYVNGR